LFAQPSSAEQQSLNTIYSKRSGWLTLVVTLGSNASTTGTFLGAGLHGTTPSGTSAYFSVDVGARKRISFEQFLYKNDHFTKTGSGQT
jgi:hypothetical protein